MTDQFLAEIRIVSFNFPPKGWAFCQGQLMSISQNGALFSLLGTTYGGDGRSTFALPNLQGAMPLGQGQGPGFQQYYLGQEGGYDSVTLQTNEMPSHTHDVLAVPTGSVNSPTGASWAVPRYGRATEKAYSTTAATATLSPTAIGTTGGGAAHNNLPPFLSLNFVIALQGIFPARQ